MSEDAASKWAAVAADYVADKLTVPQICARHGVSRAALYRQVRKGGWPRRLRLRSARSGARGAGGKPDNSRRALIARLYQVLERTMTEFEARLAVSAQTGTDHERDARTLNTMVRLLERLSALEEKGGEGKAAARDDGGAVTADAPALREDLARRLERLRPGRRA